MNYPIFLFYDKLFLAHLLSLYGIAPPSNKRFTVLSCLFMLYRLCRFFDKYRLKSRSPLAIRVTAFCVFMTYFFLPEL